MRQPVTLIFDIGKTNKKLFLFDEELNEISHEYIRFGEVLDDDGFECENLTELVIWIQDRIDQICKDPRYELRAINFSTYGASLVHIDKNGYTVAPFYNYLKPYPEQLKHTFFENYFSKDEFSLITASPSMGMLNSGLQLYYLKHAKPHLFKKLYKSIHFPQYLSSLFTGKYVSDYTSIGCHTGMWDFDKHQYANWLGKEHLRSYLSDCIEVSTKTFTVSINNRSIKVGIGIHDSSSALVPYLHICKESFVLISTGTWSVCLNPFNQNKLTESELNRDCLHFLGTTGKSIKASRLFLGKHLSNQAKLLSEFFGVEYQSYKKVKFKSNFYSKRSSAQALLFDHSVLKPERFGFKNNPGFNLSMFESYEDAFFHLMDELTDLQIASLKLVLGTNTVKNIFIDGGLSSSEVFVQMLTNKLPEYRLCLSDFPSGTALGAALLVNSSQQPPTFLRQGQHFKEYKVSTG
ncbi:FGGY family carbohydrate kinase [Fulvivirgaceae bacterium BMA10]|uniref:FGGY family carbohydrate kinase n=1 Tax=Splendidivirga corallicola TaxID=3051826 RepID=A0ABT8KKS2_9BACT|nr:FGGY family carbohydrate kinase [Fulvivirgaceae bacterium BMA10]